MNYPVVYDKLTTSFLGYGLAILENAKDICIREVLNGEYTLSFSLPINDPKWEYIEEENFVKMEGQLFVIRSIEDSHGEDVLCTVNCEHVFFLLLDEFIDYLEIDEGTSVIGALTAILNNTDHNVGNVDNTTNTFEEIEFIESKNPIQGINTLISYFGGELKVDNFEVHLLTHRGATIPNIQFCYRKNIKSIRRTVDTSGLITRLYPYGNDGLTIEDAVEGNGQKYINSQYINSYRRPKNGTVTFDTDDADELYSKALEYLASAEVPQISYEVNVIELKALSDYGALEEFALGDECIVTDEVLNMNVQARILEYERYPIEPARSRVTLATFRPGIEDRLSSLNDVKNAITTKDGKMKISTSWFEGVINVLQNQLLASGSYATKEAVVAEGKGVIFENNNINSNDYGALFIGPGVLAIANEKTGSPPTWNWRAFGTGKGFTGDEIVAGKVKAQYIEIGSETTFAPGYDPVQVYSEATGYVDTVKTDLQNQIDGKIETFFQDTDPNTWAEADRTKHTGDMWYNPNASLLKRYNGSINTWDLVRDQKTIDAFTLASTAKDIADRKRIIFTTTPTVPYSVGDLWAEGPTGELKRCVMSRAAEETYNPNDWELATKYTNNDMALQALRAAASAQETADGQIQTFYQTSPPVEHTKFLCHCENFNEELGHKITIVDNVDINYFVKKFGNASFIFNGGYLSATKQSPWSWNYTFTIDLWLSLNNTGTTQYLIGQGENLSNYWHLGIDSSGRPIFKYVKNNVCIGEFRRASSISFNTLTHLAAVFNGYTMSFFINGTKMTTQELVSVGGYFNSTFNNTYIGGSPLSILSPARGNMDEVRISDLVRWTNPFALPAAAYTLDLNYGDIWIDTDGHIPPNTDDIYRYEDDMRGSSGFLAWRKNPTNGVGLAYLKGYNAQTDATKAIADAAEAQSAAITAQTTADNKIETFYQDTAPHSEYTNVADNATYNNYVGDMWYDNSVSSRKTYRYTKTANGSNYDYTWNEMETPKEVYDTIDGRRIIYTPSSVEALPSSYQERDLMIPSTNITVSGTLFTKGDLYITNQTNIIFNKDNWMLATEYTKTTTFYQTTAPTAANKGDLWVDTDDDNQLYRMNASGTWDMVNTILDDWKTTEVIEGTTTTVIDGGKIKTNSITAEKLVVDQATIAWLNARNIVAGSVKAENIDTTTAKISTAKIEDLFIGTGGNVTMGAGAVIAWENLDATCQTNLKGEKGDQGPQGIQGIRGPAGDDANVPRWITDWGGQTIITGGWIATPKMFIGNSSNSVASGIRIESDGIRSYYNNALSGFTLGNDGTLQLWNAGTQVGEFKYDTKGQSPDAANRMFLSALTGVALKIQTIGANMSIEAFGTPYKIYMKGNVDFSAAEVTGLHAQWG